MKNLFSPSSRRIACGLLIVLGAVAAFWTPWATLACLAAALALLLPSGAGQEQALGQIDQLLGQICRGELVARIPHAMANPTLEAIRVNLNSVLDQTETTFREMLGGLEASSENR